MEIAKALCQMLDEGYVYKAVGTDEKGKKISILKPNWSFLLATACGADSVLVHEGKAIDKKTISLYNTVRNA